MGHRPESTICGARWVVAMAVLVFLAATDRSAQAYVVTVTTENHAVHWDGPVQFNLTGNPVNRSGLSAKDFFKAVTHGLDRWKQAAAGSINFDYWQGTDNTQYPANSEYNGTSSVYFASHAGGTDAIAPNVLGLTQVWYNTDTGKILEADIVLNDLDFVFTTNPRDTSGSGSSIRARSGTMGGRGVFIENVLTHELGHAFGLSHSGALQSTMLFMEAPEQARLSCDDAVGIHALYPTSDAGARGALTGQILGPDARPLVGAQVQAISRRRGVMLASGLTDLNGRYAISALEPGEYYLMAEPYFAGPSALPDFYSAMNARVCGAQLFARTVLTAHAGGNLPRATSVIAGRSVQAPPLTVLCTGSGSPAAISSLVSTADVLDPPVIFDGGTTDGVSAAASGFGVTDKFPFAGSAHYQLHGLAGHLEIHALGYSLYSPIQLSLTLLGADGRAVVAQSASPVFSASSGYQNYDGSLTVNDLPAGDYTLAVTGIRLGEEAYPAGNLALDTAAYFLITGSVNEAAPALGPTLATNARCETVENFADYQSPPGIPPKAALQNGSGGGFCGSLAVEQNRHGSGVAGGSGDRGAPPGAVAGWFLPWLLMGAMVQLVRRGARMAASPNSRLHAVPGAVNL